MASKENGLSTRLGCSEWSLRALRLPEQFECLSQLGIPFLEIGIGGDFPGHLPEIPSQAQLQEIQSLKETHQVTPEFCSIECDLTHSNPTVVSQSLNRVLKQLEIVTALGAHTINLTASQSPTIEVDEARWERFTESLAILQNEANRQALRIALMTRAVLEPQKDPGPFYIETIFTNRQALSNLAKTLPPQIRFAYEPAMFKAVNPSDLRLGFDILQKRIDQCHLQDWKPKNRTVEQTTIGQDDLNYQTLLPKLPPNTPLLITIPPTPNPTTQLQTWCQAA